MGLKIVISGDRPTGKLHLGHYVGSIKERLKLQKIHKCFFIIADIHTLTTKINKENINDLSNNIFEVVVDYLSCGIDPKISTIFLQSQITEIFQINTILGMLAPFNRINQMPSIKEMAKNSSINNNQISLGLYGYPVLQSADILAFDAEIVPVGKDNEAHIEFCRFLAKKFNAIYGDTFSIPNPLLSKTSSLIGTDGKNKMSKSLKNAIYLSDDVETVNKKVSKMYTDPNRVSADIPGKIEGNPMFEYLKEFEEDTDILNDFIIRYQNGKIGDVEIKKRLAYSINKFLEPIRAKRKKLLENPEIVIKILKNGTRKARKHAKAVLKRVLSNMRINYGF